MSLTVGLTGGIGSGKSTVADLFTSLGVAVVDTDAIAHELTAAHGAAMPAIIAAFGRAVVCANGALDRALMRRLAFSDRAMKSRLEAILHPLIRAQSEARCLATTSAYAVLVVPLLVEAADYRQRVDRILVVDCEESLQVSRVMARGLSADEVRAIMVAQASREERLAAADDVVFNNGDRQSLNAQVAALHRQYLVLSGHAG